MNVFIAEHLLTRAAWFRRGAGAVLAVGSLVFFSGADWRQFRGTATTGVALQDSAPTQLAPEMIAWQADLPGRGLSSPIVVADRVVVTASSGYRQDRLHVLCFAASDGGLLWERQFWATGRTGTHPKTCVAAPTPCSDGQRVFAFYSSNDVACLDLDGNLLWYRGLGQDFPNASNSLGMSSSPVVVDETLVCLVESDAESFAIGFDVRTGNTRWKIDRPRRANWTSPAVWPGTSTDDQRVLLQSSAGVAAVVPDTGAVEWTYSDGASTIPSLTVGGGLAFVPSHGLTALQPGRSHRDIPEIAWQVQNLAPGTASPVIDGDTVYVVNNAGVLVAVDAATGERLWQVRLRGPFSGSPAVADGHLYLFNEDGLGQVVRLGRTGGEKVSEYDFGETFLSTPAISNGALYVRSDAHLWKIAAP